MKLLDKRYAIINNELFKVNYDNTKDACNGMCSFIFKTCTVSKGRYLCDLVMSNIGVNHEGSIYFTRIKEKWYKNMNLIISSYLKTR